MSFAAGSPTSRRKTASGYEFVFPLTPSGNYATNGDPLDFGPLGPLTKQPINVDVRGISGFVYAYDLVNKKLKVFCNTAGGANSALGEHTAAALVAGVLADTITAYVTY